MRSLARVCRSRRAGERHGSSRWEISPAAAELQILNIKMRQHYETPAAVIVTVRRLWAPTFDAMASPINAICAEYATLEDDALSLPLTQRCVFVNPAYAPEDAWNGSSGIGLALEKLVGGDVRQRGCTLVALLPNLSHTAWYERYVDVAHEIHNISGPLVFPNPFLDLSAPRSSYLWRCRSYVLVVWRPGLAPSMPTIHRLALDALPAAHPATQLRMHACVRCKRLRTLPRYQQAMEGAFECSMSHDSKYNSCVVPEWVPRCID